MAGEGGRGRAWEGGSIRGLGYAGEGKRGLALAGVVLWLGKASSNV